MKGEEAILTLFVALVIVATISYILSGQPIFTEGV